MVLCSPLQELVLMLQQVGILMEQSDGLGPTRRRRVWHAAWQGLALIVVFWTGAQMALSGHGVDMAAVVRMVMGLAIPLGMLQFYTAPLPGAGRSIPHLITGMGDWRLAMIVADAGSAMLEQLGLALDAWRTAPGRLRRHGGVRLERVTDPPGVIDAASDPAVTLAPDDAPHPGPDRRLRPRAGAGHVGADGARHRCCSAAPGCSSRSLSFLFWGGCAWCSPTRSWSCTTNTPSSVMIRNTASATGLDGRCRGRYRVGRTDRAVDGVAPSLVIIPYLVAAGLATLKVGEMTRMVVSGARNAGSGASTRAVQTAAVVRMAVTGGV